MVFFRGVIVIGTLLAVIFVAGVFLEISFLNSLVLSPLLKKMGQGERRETAESLRHINDLALTELSLCGSHGERIIKGAGTTSDVVTSTAVVSCVCGGRVVVGVAEEGYLDATLAGACCEGGG